MFKGDGVTFFSSELEDRVVTPISAESSLASRSLRSVDSGVRPLLDLNRELIASPASTFFARLRGDSMEGDGDLLIIDKSVEPHDGSMVVASIDGEFVLKRVKVENETLWLVSAGSECSPIKIEPDNDYVVWGVVKYLIKKI